jgi:tetratricopeptide (TPR) repeat protein
VGYWTYYLLWTLFAYATRVPWLFAGLLVLLFVQRFLPRPDALLHALRHARRLRMQVEINAADILARRDLARIYLDLMRPRAALVLLEQALTRAPADAELLYLSGLALSRSGRREQALPRFVQAVGADARVAFGRPYLAAGDALYALARWEEAIDAYERYASTNSSDVGVYTRLARAHFRAGDRAEAKKALVEALHTFRVLRGGNKRRAFARYLEAQWLRTWLLKEPGAIARAAVLLALVGAASLYGYRAITRPGHSESAPRVPMMGGVLLPSMEAQVVSALQAEVDKEERTLARAQRACGTQHAGDFAGHYTLVTGAPGESYPANWSAQDLAAAQTNNATLDVLDDRIVWGALRQEFCLTRTLEHSASTLRSEALFSIMPDSNQPRFMADVALSREQAGLVKFTFHLRAPFGQDDLQRQPFFLTYRKQD